MSGLVSRRSVGLVLAAALLVPKGPAHAEKAERPSGGPGTVTLPLAEYDRLTERAAHPPKQAVPPPLPAVLSRADVRLKASGTDVRGTLTLEGEVLRSGPTLIPLLKGATVLDARLLGKPLPLVSGDSGLGAVVNGPGPFSIVLEWGTSITQEPGQAAFVLPTPAAGSVRVSLEVPGGAADVRVQPGLVTARTSAGGRTLVEATLDPGSNARFSWSARETTAPVARESRFLSDVKTLLTVGEADLRLAALLDVNVVQGEPSRFLLRLPARFEVTSVSGASLDKTEEAPGQLALLVRDPTRRRHQFLVTLERSNAGGSFAADAEMPSVEGAQRETGEAAIEGLGTLELTATEGDGVRRIDVRETAPALRGLARAALLAAFRYQRKADVVPRLALDVKRYPSAPVLAALAERAVVTTLSTSEGRTLTEVTLTVRNHAQPFLKVGLPEGATLLTAEVAGESVKPVKGDGGTRVPLLRAGFRPDGPYTVSFVYMLPGTPFAKRGDARLAVPRMDVPINVLEWELFLPDRFRVKGFLGQALAASLLPMGRGLGGAYADSVDALTGGEDEVTAMGVEGERESGPRGNGQVMGHVTDPTGAVLPGATVRLSGSGIARFTITDARGDFLIDGVPAGPLQLSVEMTGFGTRTRSFTLREGKAVRVDTALQVAGLAESVVVNAAAPEVARRAVKSPNEQQAQAPSANVFNLQQKVAGVLPVRMDIPRAGASYRFVRPLVIDEETSVSFSYKTR